ncbi:MAG: hypothetical protein ACMG6H_07550 [Acidobacteriota bacterium]
MDGASGHETGVGGIDRQQSILKPHAKIEAAVNAGATPALR